MRNTCGAALLFGLLSVGVAAQAAARQLPDLPDVKYGHRVTESPSRGIALEFAPEYRVCSATPRLMV
jgi:hypothetical protein